MFQANLAHRHFSIPKEVRSDVWLSSTSDAEKYLRLYFWFPESELNQTSSTKMLSYQDGQLSRHYIAEISLNVTLNHNQPTNQPRC